MTNKLLAVSNETTYVRRIITEIKQNGIELFVNKI